MRFFVSADEKRRKLVNNHTDLIYIPMIQYLMKKTKCREMAEGSLKQGRANVIPGTYGNVDTWSRVE